MSDDKVTRLTVDFWPVESQCQGVPEHRFQWFGDSESDCNAQLAKKLETDKWFLEIFESWVEHKQAKDGLIVMAKFKLVPRKKVERASCDD